MAINLLNTATGTIKLRLLDAAGAPFLPPPAGGSVTSSRPDYLAATLGSDGVTVTLVPAVSAVVSVTVTYANGGIVSAAPLVVNITSPVLAGASFDESSFSQTPR